MKTSKHRVIRNVLIDIVLCGVALVVFALIVPVLLRRVSRPQPFEAPRPAPEAAASPLPPRLRVRKDESENNAP